MPMDVDKTFRLTLASLRAERDRINRQMILVIVGLLVFTNSYVYLNAWAISLTPEWLRNRL